MLSDASSAHNMPEAITLLGKRGEYAIGIELLRPLANGAQPIFDPCHLGEKAELLDFVVRLQKDGHPSGPYFFLQVKATGVKPEGGSIRAEFSREEVARAHAMKAPVYVAAVDASECAKEKVYIQPIYDGRTKGISRIKTSQPLAEAAIRQALYDEVETHFNSLQAKFKAPLGHLDEFIDEEQSHV